MLSGNRNFEGRINPDVKMNYLASPPLVVAYALAGRMDIDLLNEPLGEGSDGQPVYLRDIWPSPAEVQATIDSCIDAEMFTSRYADVFAGDEKLAVAPDAHRRHVRLGRRVDLRAQAAVLRRHGRQPAPVTDIAGARVLAQARRLGHHRPHQPGRLDQGRQPGGPYLAEHGVERKDFNSYGSRRGNHEVMIRGTFANIRLRNQLLDGVEGGYTRDFTQATARRRRSSTTPRRTTPPPASRS